MTFVNIITAITVLFAVAAGCWLLKTAFVIKVNRRSLRKEGKGEIYVSPRTSVDAPDPVPVDDGKDFNPDDVELTIDPVDSEQGLSVVRKAGLF